MATASPSAALPESNTKVQGPQRNLQQQQHPRRSPPRNIGSFPAKKIRKVSRSPDEAVAPNVPISQLKSQGSSSGQSASHWFDSANQHVKQGGRANNGYDDEPPFYMSHQASYVPNGFVPSEGSRMFGVQSRLDSENEDLRGIVDDLTIENKRLKNILRLNQRSQRGSPSTEDQDRLFEVRMHGLSADKRRELEFLLKNFATSVHTSTPSVPNSTADSGLSSSGAPNARSKTDSGYASNSNAGNTAIFNSRPSARATPNQASSHKQLHNIPDTLLPRQQPIMMSERSKMALVVRRLEQLFTGRTAVPGEHSQPLQQQEVSQMAARADSTNSKKRKAEGTREAHILPPESKVNFDAFESVHGKRKKVGHKTSDSDMSTSEETPHDVGRIGSPDQRPTRPLDLDIHRAQVADENIQYIRHLGFSSPHLDACTTTDESWMFLNLLVNMAQLHTINVTPDFVRKSIKKLSTKFELSKDGFKVRWVGGPEGTIFSKEEEKALEVAEQRSENTGAEESNEESGNSGSSKRSKTNSTSNAVTSNTTSDDIKSGLQTSTGSKQRMSTEATSNLLSQVQSKPTTSGSTFDYKPIVYRGRQILESEESYLIDSDSSLEEASRDSSGLAHALSRSNLGEKRKADEGTITFYNNPFYCSDYSGDKKPSNLIGARDFLPGLILGSDGGGDDFRSESSRLAEACYFTPQFGPPPFRPSQNEKLPELILEPLSTHLKEEIQPLEFFVSGLSGVEPRENFAIDVDVHMKKAPAGAEQRSLRCIPITGTEVKATYVYKTGASYKIDLLPSRLPPPSYIFFTSSSSSGNQIDDEDDELTDSEGSSTDRDQENPTPPSFLQQWSTHQSGEPEDDLDDSSVDLLAPARAADPVRVAEQERQYLINQPGGRAVAGSLAATVGASPSVSSVADEIASNEPEVASDSGEENEEEDEEDDNDDGDDYEMQL